MRSAHFVSSSSDSDLGVQQAVSCRGAVAFVKEGNGLVLSCPFGANATHGLVVKSDSLFPAGPFKTGRWPSPTLSRRLARRRALSRTLHFEPRRRPVRIKQKEKSNRYRVL